MAQKTLPKWIILLFFLIGVISAISFRAIIIIAKFDPHLSRIIWYIGVIGYIIFFAYRFYISLKRRRTIIEGELLRKLKQNKLSQEDCQNVAYILKSLIKSKEMYNYIIIFALSAGAIVADLII